MRVLVTHAFIGRCSGYGSDRKVYFTESVVVGHGPVSYRDRFVFLNPLADPGLRLHAIPMFVVTEADAALIRDAFERSGELGAVAELRRLFPALQNDENARACARSIAGWKPMPAPPQRKRSAEVLPLRRPRNLSPLR